VFFEHDIVDQLNKAGFDAKLQGMEDADDDELKEATENLRDLLSGKALDWDLCSMTVVTFAARAVRPAVNCCSCCCPSCCRFCYEKCNIL